MNSSLSKVVTQTARSISRTTGEAKTRPARSLRRSPHHSAAKRLLPLVALGLSTGVYVSPSELFAAEKPTKSAKVETADQQPAALDDVVVTASAGLGESIKDVPQTIKAYSAEEILQSAPRALNDFLSQNAIGFVNNTSPVHTVLNLRGSATGGQGQSWNDLSSVAVLINGRSAGTANLGKLTAADVESIEVLRGPNSVLYGSSAVGGVINIITKTGQTFQGTDATTTVSSHNRFSETIQTGGQKGRWDYYAEVSGTKAGDYKTGSGSLGTQKNTGYKEFGGNVTLGYEITDLIRGVLLIRHNGAYDAHHPGVTYSLSDYDNRTNTGVEFRLSGENSNKTIKWTNQAFYTNDVDEFHWSQNPVIGVGTSGGINGLFVLNNTLAIAATGTAQPYPKYLGTPGISSDFNTRNQSEFGDNFSFQFKPIEHNTAQIGFQFKFTDIDNTRDRTAAPGFLTAADITAANFAYLTAVQRATIQALLVPQTLPPLVLNTQVFNSSIYAQDTHKFLDDKATIRLGGRYDYIDQKALTTQNSPVTPQEQTHGVFVYQAGSTYKANSWLTLRGNAATGFLSPSATWLFGAVKQANGVTINGSKDLKNETTFGWDVGANASAGGFNADVAFFESITKDPFYGALTPGTTIYQLGNGDSRVIHGLEIQTSYDLAKAFGVKGFQFEPYISDNITLKAKVSGNKATRDVLVNLNDYNLSAGIRFGQPERWTANVYALSAGKSWLQPAGENIATTAYPADGYARIPSYTIVNFTFTVKASKHADVFAGVNNLFNKNYDANFYGLNNNPSIVAAGLSPGSISGSGISSPGREIFAGVSLKF
jgi:vitamin B12 transporter